MYAALAILVALIGMVFWASRVGAAKERAKQAEATLEAIHDKKEKDDEVANLAPADLDKRFNRWMR